jgi:radical SAM protein with 4Fe4S-binding SPASM domain
MIEFSLIEHIATQLPSNIVVQLHNNGEPTLYPKLKEAIMLFDKQITNFVTNGKLLVKKADEIIGHLDTMAISVFEKDDEADEQFEIIRQFLLLKADQKPHTILRINGNVKNIERYLDLGLTIAYRYIHSPEGSFNYKKDPTIPEIGICLDFLNHLAINKDGDVSICVRFDPKRLGVIGNAKKQSLIEIWNSPWRMQWLENHKRGQREAVPLCQTCQFWGVPTGKPSQSLKKIDVKNYFLTE